jgi:glycosyltransferase 2 family protein
LDERDRQPGTGRPRLGSRSLRWAKQLFRLLVLALVAWGIYHALSRAGARLDDQQFALREVDPRWLAVAGVCYVIGLVPCWIFWHRTLRAMGQFPGYRESLTAFWIGHLGKYVPGKAMVVVLRTALVHGPLVNKTVAATSVFVETLTMMAVGAFVSAVILVVTSDQRALTLLAIGLMLGAGLPTFPPIFRRLVRLLQVHRANPDITAAIAGVGYALMAAGWIMIAVGWVFLGLSLWATLRALPIADPSGDIPLLTAAVGLAMVAGFLSLIPGGLGVRDGILITLLAPTMGGRVAIVSAILLRVVWLAAELVVSALLYGTIVIGPPRDGKTIRSHD